MHKSRSWTGERRDASVGIMIIRAPEDDISMTIEGNKGSWTSLCRAGGSIAHFLVICEDPCGN